MVAFSCASAPPQPTGATANLPSLRSQIYDLARRPRKCVRRRARKSSVGRCVG